MSTAADAFHAFVTKLEDEGHHLAAEGRALFARFHGDEQRITQEAQADAEQIKHDAAPVVAEAKTDAEKLATEATADVKDATKQG